MNQLKDPPSDGISCLRFAPSTNTIAASSWDSVDYGFFFYLGNSILYTRVIRLHSNL